MTSSKLTLLNCPTGSAPEVDYNLHKNLKMLVFLFLCLNVMFLSSFPFILCPEWNKQLHRIFAKGTFFPHVCPLLSFVHTGPSGILLCSCFSASASSSMSDSDMQELELLLYFILFFLPLLN